MKALSLWLLRAPGPARTPDTEPPWQRASRISPPESLMIVFCLWLCVQEDGELILEGLLNIYWGLRRPIRLQMHDDNERFRFKRYNDTQSSQA